MPKYAILGSIQLCDGDRRVGVGGPGQVALLAVLLLHANRALSRDELIDALWGDEQSGGAAKRLQVAIGRLRRTLEPGGTPSESVLQTTAAGYLLAVAPGELDAELFTTRLEQGCRTLEAGDPARARTQLAEALALWRGPALAEVAYQQFARTETRRLEELRLAAIEARVDADLQLGEHGSLVGELEALAAAHPLRERFAAQLMRALYRAGRQGEALEIYTCTRAYLSSELGIEPGPALQALQAEVLAQSPALPSGTEPAASAPPAPGPVEAARGPVALALPRSLALPRDSPFVGREGPSARLRESWSRVRDGVHPAVLVGGEAGIGKTCLASQLAVAVHAEGALVLHGRCDEGLAVPYQPFVEALRPYVRAVGPQRLRVELPDLATELRRLLPELASLGEPTRADPESERFAMFEAVAVLIELASREQPVLLVVEDLHWATNPTLMMLRHLIRSEHPFGALVLGTYRETELDAEHPLAQLLADLHRDASVQVLRLVGLDERSIAELLQTVTDPAVQERTVELAELLRSETAGNPFFVRELTAHLVESGSLASLAPDTLRSPAGLDVPERLRHVIENRVARLSPAAQHVLRVGAVAGAAFSPALLEVVIGPAPGLLDALDEAVAAGLLIEDGLGEYVFGHALVRQMLYRQLGATRRMRLHGQLGDALEAAGPQGVRVELLAHHFSEAAAAGWSEKATELALAASHAAIARLGFEEAVGHCERGLAAIDVAGRPDDERRCELLLALGEACSNAGDSERARATCLEAADLAESLGDDGRLARAALGFCGPLFFNIAVTRTAPSVGLLERALARLGAPGGALRAQLMGRLAAQLAYAGGERRAPALARAALDLARSAGDRATLADVLATTHWSLRGPDNLAECRALAAELVALAEAVGDVRLLTYGQQWHVEHLLERGDIEAVKRELAGWERRVEPLSRRSYLGWLLAVVRARHAYLEGRLEESEALTHDALSHGYAGQDEPVAHTFAAQMLVLRREQARLGEIVAAVEQFSATNPHILAWRAVLADTYARLGRIADARRLLDELACDGFAVLPRDGLWLGTATTLAEVATMLGDTAHAPTLYQLMAPYADHCTVVLSFLCQGAVARPLGMLAGVMGEYDASVRHFEAALELNARIRSPLWVAHTQHDYAAMLLARGRTTDREAARGLLAAATAAAHDFGLASLASKLGPLRLRAGGAA